MTWTDKLSVGVKELDEDHKQLVGMINTLYDGMSKGKGKETLGPILDGLIGYARFHFGHEEEFFAKSEYPHAAAHKAEHNNFTRQVLDIQTRLRSGAAGSLSLEGMNFLKNWLVVHIQGSDKKYGAHFNANGIY